MVEDLFRAVEQKSTNRINSPAETFYFEVRADQVTSIGRSVRRSGCLCFRRTMDLR